MPIFNDAKTVTSESIWRSPDGQREIFKVSLEVAGKQFEAKTYSKDISNVGFSGDIESYEKPGRGGKPAETFVKQAPKDGGAFGSGIQTSAPRGSAQSTGGKFDNYTMYLSYAKDIAVAMLDKSGKLDEAAYGQVLSAVSNGGDTLYEGRPDAPKKDVNVDPQELDVVIDPDAEVLNDLFPGQ